MRKSKPSEEIQSLLDMLFVQDHDIFKGLHINLRRSGLNGADLQGAHLEKADLSGAHLQGADLSGAQLQGSLLRGAHLQGANLSGTDMRGASNQGNLSYTYAQRMGRESDERSTLAGATFEGGLSREDVDSIVEGLSDEKARELRKKMEPHIGKPASNQPPNSAITGTYTAEEAEQWIAEYEEVMSVFNEADDS